MKALLLICDGMADRPVAELDGRTPLEAAKKPNMDELARRGVCGLMDTIAPGVPPGSDTAHLALLGYDPYEVYTGRGPFEAAGAGIELKPGDIALRANFATVDEDVVVKDRRAGRIQEADQLAAALRTIKLRGAQVIFRSTVGHRGALVLRGKGLSHEVTDSDPHLVGAKVARVRPLSRKAAKTARLLNEFSRKAHELLESHPLNEERRRRGLPPANYLLLRGAGVVPRLRPIRERFGIEGACVAAAAIVKGVCRLAGMKVIDVVGATGGVDTNLDAKRGAALQALEHNDLVLLHVKGFDEASHDGNAAAKVQFIERVDDMLGQLLEAADLIAIAADHTTPVSVREHTGDPVPVLIAGPGVRADDVRRFDERSCARGGLGRIRGKDLLPIIVDLMGKGRKFGA
ncbi:MAG: 2,3-bisphosphoglycerate-independent phosphoglycerate mutase [Hadesarchaea archaeon]|nr:2,3-bisphosphoglycerate-independent phosphoglycerate mutase [Hadesarchaea archaeon]